ncbi:hypothetical protein HJC23_007389 [Cyclotella cryptica]|uniref:RNA helicase n=1 Tax=Cyclotella cryptica TaxID=29204 RepID=A0ABD3Q549_9STRA|eukprot:CCRYP_008720-RA/>CCRYP_008720-RA protein AED:0.02 eAED:0.02 QI:209/1/1/1/1/1/9/216/2019
MGVHGLTGFLQQTGFHQKSNDATTVLSHNSTTLAIDGNGLIFHLFRIAYYRHRKTVLSSSAGEALQSQLLLPTLVPLSLAHDVTTSYLSGLTIQHGIHLRIYFDGPDQCMKHLEKCLRDERRGESWENVRQLCIHGTLPDSGESKYRSSARKQKAKEHQRRMADEFGTGDGSDAEAELYLASFPVGSLLMSQIERSIESFVDMTPVLPCGSIQVLRCDGEADAEVARASADDASGMTYALAYDSDYLIYGYSNEYGQNGQRLGETKYLRFGEVDPSSDEVRVGNVLTRADVAKHIGLPCSSALVEWSILLGNDYTRPFVKHDDMPKRKEYWESICWYRQGDEDSGVWERLPAESEMSWFDIEGIAEHVAAKVGDGWRLTSHDSELKLGIEFSYSLYSFGDISRFSPTAPGSESDGEDDPNDYVNKCATVFPALPRELDLSLARNASNNLDLIDVSLLPLESYKSLVEPEEGNLNYIEQRHIDAYRKTLEIMMSGEPDQHIGPPRHKMQWTDVQALYVFEKCLLAAIDNADIMPYSIFSHSIFHSCLESFSFSDSSLDNELVSKNEKAFVEEATAELPLIREGTGEAGGPLVLPIDVHKDEILNTVKTQRVTIIHGETGCGKSSRVPCFLLRADAPEPSLAAPEVKIMISQPRRIAAKSLAERVRSCEPDLTDKIALRMGHGIREYETSNTRAWFVTTGYLVRLLANHPEWFDSVTHLVIDEVHERSVDTDILCLLCRRLLKSHPTIRLVLMSATIAAELYSQYFGVPQPPIHVGARRFPIKEYYVEDLSVLLSLSPKKAALAQQIFTECEKNKCRSAPSADTMKKLYNLAVQITTAVGDAGCSILIFVPGMADIEEICELIERVERRNVSFTCLPIHSEIPFEEQMAAFIPPQKGEIKVIIATNAAESSLTLPDCDHVICLGLCKQIMYNTASHRQMLVPTWISRASATQRAGRTGRVRPGSVYRLYTRSVYTEYMSPFEVGEMVRIPLDQVILSLRDMLGEAVTPILLECLEPPDLFNIEQSFRSLYESNFISDPTDKGEITKLGSLVVALGIDLTLGALVGLGIQFGVAAEAIQLAAILSCPKTPWAVSSPMYHDADTLNEIVSSTFTSRCFFDAGLFSDPMGIANLLSEYSSCKNTNAFVRKHGLSGTRLRHLCGTIRSLQQRVAEYLNIPTVPLEVKDPPCKMPHAKLNILRILQVWIFHNTIITHDSSKNKFECTGDGLSINLDGPPIDRKHLSQILHEDRHPFEIRSSGKIFQQVRFDPQEDPLHSDFDVRFASYVLEKKIDFSCYFFQSSFKLVVPADNWETKECQGLINGIVSKFSVTIEEKAFLGNSPCSNRRGIRGRACGTWHPPRDASVLGSNQAFPQKHIFMISCQLPKSQIKEIKMMVDIAVAKSGFAKSSLSCVITKTKKAIVSVEIAGLHDKISDLDLVDMFSSPNLVATVTNSTVHQSVHFPPVDSSVKNNEHNIRYPLLEDAPEGARLMIVLACERRKDLFIRFSDDGSDESFVDANLPKLFSINGKKWHQKGGGGKVFVPTNSVPAAVIPIPAENKCLEIFACCANTLDLRGGMCRVEGISLLPPGRLFVGLALLSFGFHPRSGLPIVTNHMNEDVEEKKEADEFSHVISEALEWIFEKENTTVARAEEWRIFEALDFHTSCIDLGEVLECQPDKIKALCALFEGVGGPMAVWDGFDVTLAASRASCRPKPAKKNHIGDIALNDANKEEKESDTSIGQSYVKLEMSKTKTPSKTNNSCVERKSCPASSMSNDTSLVKSHHPPKSSYACLKCKAIFPVWEECLSHRTGCCPDTKMKRKKARALACELEANVRDSTVLRDLLGKDNINVKHSEQTEQKTDPQIVNGRWACEGCNATFAKRRKCVEHMEQCCLVHVKNLTPKFVFVCTVCNMNFQKLKKFTLHMNSCLGTSLDGMPSVSDQLKQNPAPQNVMRRYACEGCNTSFSKRKKCAVHIEQCNFVPVKNSTPKRLYICTICNANFAQVKKCRLHLNACLGTPLERKPSC